MRKLLLATSALLGTSFVMASVGHAGTLTPNAPNPAPGSITVTLNALVEAFVFDGTDSGLSSKTSTLYGGSSGKYQTYGVGSYARMYPSFDGVLANGLKYGGSIEVRQKGGFQTGSTTAAAFYAQREYLYVGADKFGKFEAGDPVQPTEYFQTGNPANFNTGGWDGDLPGVFGVGLPYFIDDSNDRAEKVVYISPQFVGFDFGVSFEPTGTAVSDFPTIDRASSVSSGSTLSSLIGRRRNTVDGALRYTGAFGPLGVKANAGATVGAAVHSDDSPLDFKAFNLFGGGVSVTFGGLEVDGHIDYGQYGPGLSATSAGHTTAYVTGASYTIGPWIMGASYYGFDSGFTRTTSLTGSALHGYGIAAGGTYTLAPGASVFLEYLYGHQRADGVDLVNGGASVDNNNTRAQAFGLGTALKW
jgi:predicted porin